MSRITPVTGIALALLLALIAVFAVTAPRTEAAPTAPERSAIGIAVNGPIKAIAYYSSDLRVAVGCSPLTSSQAAQPGDPQLCRIRIRNHGSVPITGITHQRLTPNTITARYGYGYIPLTCNLSGCQFFTLNPGQTAYIFEEATFNATADGRGKTTTNVWGYQGNYQITASATEQTNLP